MKILFDHQAFTMQHFGGVSKCFCELISHLPSRIDYQISLVESNNIHLHNTNLCPEVKSVSMDFHKFSSKYPFRGKGKIYKILNSLNYHTTENINKEKSIELLKKGNYNIFHPTFYDDYFLKYLKGKPFILTIHDMMPELFPEYYKRNDKQILAKRKLAPKAAAIIAVSEQTKKDIIDILNIPDNKIHVVYHGGPSIENLKVDSLFKFPYFLYVGQRGAYKNFQQLLEDFSIFVINHKNVKLICTGPEFTIEEYNMIKFYHLENNIEHKKSSEQELKYLYANAIAFIYPSLYEGFGMPILEAFAYGCPVLLNRKSCFPEIANDAAIYFKSDKNGSNLVEILEYFYNLTDFQKTVLIKKGYERLSKFSWKESARKLSNIYQLIQ